MGVSDMKKFILNIFVFFCLVAAIDAFAGLCFGKIQQRAGGRTGAECYACSESKEDVIIMGSSRASHHYVPEIISDSLGMTCFNAGQDGNGIILQYGRWKMISERYIPKVIIYDVTRGFDLAANDNMAYVDRLKPFCGDDQVREYVAGIFPMERLKLFSKMYRYNYKFIEMLSDCRVDNGNALKGYIPLYGQIRQEMVEKAAAMPNEIKAVDYDETKLKYIEQLAKECQEAGTKLFFVVSPYYGGGGCDRDSFRPVIEIAVRYGVPFYYYNETDLIGRPELFKDSSHLNDEGAREFTKTLMSQIRIWVLPQR